ncbi:MAG: putative glycoside hydrolase [Vallitaleaceae bacterium]|nr:putative glycoside hydrolase [Vallitaleaceae bacterium]
MNKKDQNTQKKSVKGWLVLLVSGLLCIAIAVVYRFVLNKDEISEVPLDPTQTIEGENSKEKATVQEPTKEAIIDFSDFMPSRQEVSTVFKTQAPIRGIFLTANTAGIETSLDKLIQLADETEINAFVIDVKNDDGNITFDINVPLVDEIGSEDRAIRNINIVMDKLYNHNIYPIARIVAFKDPYLSSHVTDYAIKNADGSLFYYKKISWLNPYNKDCWKYIIDVAKEAAKAGFKEIQFDYIRFEATHSLDNANFGETNNLTRMDVIASFIDYAKTELKPYDVVVSADVFGTIIESEVDAKMIGQNYQEMAKRLDVICPMVYPSHYGRGYFGLPSTEPPDLHPYEIIFGSMQASNEVLMDVVENKAIVRPWLQAFTASYLGSGEYMTYDGSAIRKQIQGAYDAGLTEWLLWNAGNRYSSDGLQPQ